MNNPHKGSERKSVASVSKPGYNAVRYTPETNVLVACPSKSNDETLNKFLNAL